MSKPINQLIYELRYVRAELERVRAAWHEDALTNLAESERRAAKNPHAAECCDVRAKAMLEARRELRNVLNFIENVPGVMEPPAPRLQLIRNNAAVAPTPKEEADS